MREFIDAVKPLLEGVWGRIGRTTAHIDPTRSDFLALMRNTKRKHHLSDGEVILRGFIDFHGNVIVFDAYNHTHDEAIEATGDELGYNDTRLSFWTDTGVVGIGTMKDAESAMKNAALVRMMGGAFEVEACY